MARYQRPTVDQRQMAAQMLRDLADKIINHPDAVRELSFKWQLGDPGSPWATHQVTAVVLRDGEPKDYNS